MIGPIAPFNSIGAHELDCLQAALERPLSGYLAGQERGGYCVQELEAGFSALYTVKHSIAVNSATSGLLAAAFAIGLGPGDDFICPALTMSATAAAPMFTGAVPRFCDVDDRSFTLAMPLARIMVGPRTKAIFVTNLFGNPARLHALRNAADELGIWLIEDNAQAPLAMETPSKYVRPRFAGTIGHIGVFSFNVHKPLQCGEGGMIVTDCDDLAGKMRAFINHGEHIGERIGLNLRMPELCAAVALAQVRGGDTIIDQRIEQALAILNAIGVIPGLWRPIDLERPGRPIFYTIPFVLDDWPLAGAKRNFFCDGLKALGVPIVEGYVDPLYRLPAFKAFARPCPVAEDLHDRRLFYIENCRYTFAPDQIRLIGEAFKRTAEKVL